MVKNIYEIIYKCLNIFFHLLYHSFAWSYDFVADIVSLGQWKQWVNTAIPFISGNRILELGPGPGHLQKSLIGSNNLIIGLDESMQMCRQAYRRINNNTKTLPKIIRGKAESIPFTSESFDSVVSTFPTTYIFQPSTLSEIIRVLSPKGHLIILVFAWITGRGILSSLLRWIYTITGETPPITTNFSLILEPFNKAGFLARLQWIDLKTSCLLAIIASKP